MQHTKLMAAFLIIAASILIGIGVTYSKREIHGEVANKRGYSDNMNIDDADSSDIFSNQQTNNLWSQCVGTVGEDCRQYIEESSPELKVYIIPPGSVLTMDYNLKRVRIFVDKDGIVIREPKKG